MSHQEEVLGCFKKRRDGGGIESVLCELMRLSLLVWILFYIYISKYIYKGINAKKKHKARM